MSPSRVSKVEPWQALSVSNFQSSQLCLALCLGPLFQKCPSLLLLYLFQTLRESLPVSVAVSPDSILLQRLQEQPGVDVWLQPDSEALQGVLLQPGLEVGEGVSSTVIGLAVGLSLSTVVILGFVGFGYLLYRVSR